MRKGRTTLNEATKKRLNSLWYEGKKEPYDVFRWLMDKKQFYVMPHPKPYNVWGVWILILGKPNTLDGKINMCDLGKERDSYDSALVVGIEFIVDVLYKAQKTIFVKTKEELEEIRESCQKAGFAV